MAFTTVSTNTKYVKYTACKKGDVILDEGSYLGTSEGKFGLLHNFAHTDGSRTVLNKAGQLDYLLRTHAQVGTMCRVTFDGTVKLTKGLMAGKDANQFILATDKGAFTPTDVPAPNRAAALDISL